MYAGEYCELMARRGRREATVEGIRYAIARCSQWLEARGIESFEQVTPDDVAEMAYTMGGKESTRKQYVTRFGGYLRWLTGKDVVRQALIMWNPVGDESRAWITAEDFRALMGLAGPRERLILALGATMGLRRSEMCALDMEDVADGSVRIRGKGHGPEGKVATKEASEAVRRELAAYLKVRPRSEDRALLLSARGRRLDPSSIYWLLKGLGDEAGVRLPTHALRRLYATTLADAGVPLETIARMMRHESPLTTMRCYLRADPRRMGQAQAQVDALLAVRGRNIQIASRPCRSADKREARTHVSFKKREFGT